MICKSVIYISVFFLVSVTNTLSWSINTRSNPVHVLRRKGSDFFRKIQLSAVIIEEETTTRNPKKIERIKKSNHDESSTSSWKWRRENIRIRTTQYEDLDQISNILTHNVNSYQNINNSDDDAISNNNKYDWNQMISNLRTKSNFKTQLSHRLHAVIQGKDAFDKINESNDECIIVNEYLSQVWHSHDKFRKSIELAAHTTSIEECYWDNHSNFAIPPEDDTYLHHTMISIEDNNNDNDIIGFCEIAILPIPSLQSTSIRHADYGPFIVNLVIKDSHRRRGIAKHIIHFIRKHVRLNYSPCFTTLGLYVHEHNLGAIRLYENEGFVLDDNSNKKGELCFMQREL